MQPQRITTLIPRNTSASGAVFATRLGWIALVTRNNVLQRLSFGHTGADSAAAAVGLQGESIAANRGALASLVVRFTEYAAGHFDDFLDIEVDTTHLTPFAKAVSESVRRIPFGGTRSYGELAALVGRPRAARAVGGVMARNRTPLVVPCHRVLGSGGALGGFSAIDGLQMKRRLLELEAGALAIGR
jgi:methylated-DNA-[protein]-cysteine S-methyltransferase